MIVDKSQTETYLLTDLNALDPVTVYVTNYKPGQGKIVIECYGSAWSCFWGSMGEQSLQKFFLSCHNAYILGKILDKTTQTDFDKINEAACKKGYSICVTNDVEVAMQASEMEKCFGSYWYMDLPMCNTPEYKYVDRIIDAIKGAFGDELKH